MDKKTFEYMKLRTKAYERLEEEKKTLEEMKESINKTGVVEVRLYCWNPNTTTETDKHIKNYVLKAIDERLSEIEKEMEEI